MKVVVAALAVLLPLATWAMQGSSPPATQESTYSNGSAALATPGVSQFKPKQESGSSFKRPDGSQLGSQPEFGSRMPLSSDTFRTQSYQDDSDVGQPSRPGYGSTTQCTVEYVDEVDIPALETGQLIELNVRESDEVPSSKVIARTDDKLIRLQLLQSKITMENAEKIARDMTQIEAAEKQIQLTRQRYETTMRLAAKGARSADEKLTAQYEYEVAKLQRRAARVRQEEAIGTALLEGARKSEVEERLKRHEIVCPFDGAVVQLFKQKGEWVTAGEPVAKVARMNKLYVTGLISNRDYNPDQVAGKEVIVTVRLAGTETMEFMGRITTIGLKDVSGSGNEYLVKAEIDNKMKQGQWVLRKDASVSMEVKL